MISETENVLASYTRAARVYDRTAPAAHFASVTAAHKLVSPTPSGADQAGQAGSLTAAAHGIAVAAVNEYGVATPVLAASAVTPTVNKSVDVTIAQVAGATHYMVFLSLSTTAPQWVATVTEAQRAAGCAVTAVGTVGAGGSAGVVNVRVVGTGLATTSYAANNAYTPASVATPFSCAGKDELWVFLDVTGTTGAALPTLTLVPFYSRNEDAGVYYQGAPVTVTLQTIAGASFRQVLSMPTHGNKYAKVLVGTITGCTVALSGEQV